MAFFFQIMFIVLCVLLAVFYVIGRIFADFALKRGSNADSAIKDSLKMPDEQKNTAQITEEKKLGEAKIWRAKIHSVEYDIQSKDGLNLHGYFYPNENGGHQYAILLHGFQDDYEFMEPYALQYHRMGYHNLIPDQRAHGQSDGTYTTMGWNERDDLLEWIQFIIDKDPNAQIVLHGVSMGASTIMLASGIGFPDNVKACVADCGYTTLWDEYKGKIKEMFHIPAVPLLVAADVAARIKPGFWIHKISAVEALRNNQVPMLFIHGDADDYNPYWMMEELYLADASADKEKLTVHQARHARSIYTDYEQYWKVVENFCSAHMQKNNADL